MMLSKEMIHMAINLIKIKWKKQKTLILSVNIQIINQLVSQITTQSTCPHHQKCLSKIKFISIIKI
jgi:hypothetical protein